MSQWTECQLGDVVTLHRGYDLPERQRISGSVPIISSSVITGYHDVAKVHGPGVVTGRYGTLGSVFFIQDDFWPLNTALYVSDFKGNDPRFISYLLQTLDLGRHNSAGAVPGINRNALHMVPVRVPDIDTQREIASTLGAYDDLIENNTRRIAILEQMARSIYQEWFEEFRFPGHERVRMVASELGMIPEGWAIKRFSDAVVVDPHETVPRQGSKPFVPMAAPANNSMVVQACETREGNSGTKFRNGDTLLARITPCLENGKTAFVQFLPTPNDVALDSTEFIVLRGRSVGPEYVYLAARSDRLRSAAIKSMSGATGRQRVQPSCFDRLLVAQPDRRALATFTQTVGPLFGCTISLAMQNTKLRHMRDLLLPKLIGGAITKEREHIAAFETCSGGP